MKWKANSVTNGALIAAIYTVLTIIANSVGLASGMVQVRVSEALTILPMFTFAAVPGLFAGCILSNLLTGAPVWDVIFGSIATLLGALGTYYFGKNKYLGAAFPIATNTIIIPFVLKAVYAVEQGYGVIALSVFLGEFISCGVLGILLFECIKKVKLFK